MFTHSFYSFRFVFFSIVFNFSFQTSQFLFVSHFLKFFLYFSIPIFRFLILFLIYHSYFSPSFFLSISDFFLPFKNFPLFLLRHFLHYSWLWVCFLFQFLYSFFPFVPIYTHKKQTTKAKKKGSPILNSWQSSSSSFSFHFVFLDIFIVVVVVVVVVVVGFLWCLRFKISSNPGCTR